MAAQYGRRKRASAREQTQQIARGLGWFSVGLGLAQVFAPRALCRLAGVPATPILMRLCGLRELVCGVGLLTQERSGPWLEARIAGDVIDLTALAGAAAFRTASGPRIAFAMAATAGITALDLHCKRTLAAAEAKVPCHVKATITVNGSADELYRFWRDLQNFPRIMPHVESVQPLGDNVYHWVALGPAGTRIEWDSELIDDQPGERLAWRSLEGSDIFNAGSVAFDRATDNFGTQVTVELLYQPPASSLGAAVAQLFGRDANGEMRADLRAFKTLIESREKPVA